MKIIEVDLKNLNLEANPNMNLVLGFFDGVHIGHQEMISKAVSNGETGVMTFDISPSFILGKSIKYTHITSLYDKANVLKTLGVKYLYVLRMNKELLNLDKSEFIEKILKPISPKRIYVGEDYHFGRNAEGTPNDLEKYFNVNVYELVSKDELNIMGTVLADKGIDEGFVYELYKISGADKVTRRIYANIMKNVDGIKVKQEEAKAAGRIFAANK